MAHIGRRWVRSFCPRCEEVRNYTVEPDWALRCPRCGHERRLAREAGHPRRRRLLAAG